MRTFHEHDAQAGTDTQKKERKIKKKIDVHSRQKNSSNHMERRTRITRRRSPEKKNLMIA